MVVDLIAMFEFPRVVGRAELVFDDLESGNKLIESIDDLKKKLLSKEEVIIVE
jgi:hypothetical protein